MNNLLTCGVAKSDITPYDDLLDGLYGLAGIPYAGIIDPLFLRVIAMSDGENRALIISFDLDKAPNPITWMPELSEHTGIPIENISYMGTHTHSAPVTTFRPNEAHRTNITDYMKSAMAKYEDMVHMELFAKVDEALANMKPAKMGYGKGESYINVNRGAEFYYEAEDGSIHSYISQGPNNEADVDRTVFVMKIEDEDGKPMGFFVNYAVHCCTMFLNRYDDKGSMGISGDIAGTVSRYIEDKFPESVAIWSSGAAGDVNPIIANEVFYADPKNGARIDYLFPDYKVITELMISLAARHFQDILGVIRGIDNFSNAMKIGGAIEWSETEAYKITSPSKGVFEITGEREKPYRIRLHLLRLGDVALYGVGGEMFSSFGKMMREIAPFSNTVIINHEASLIDDSGYVLDDATLERVRRSSPVSGMLPGRNSATKPGQVGESLKEHTESLFHKVL